MHLHILVLLLINNNIFMLLDNEYSLISKNARLKIFNEGILIIVKHKSFI